MRKSFAVVTQALILLGLLLIVGSIVGGSVFAAEKLNTQEIHDYLSDRSVKGEQKGKEWRQMFYANGLTQYFEGTYPFPGEGKWRAQDDLYCSQWPPSAHWDCYELRVNGDDLVFVPISGGDHWPAVRQPKH